MGGTWSARPPGRLRGALAAALIAWLCLGAAADGANRRVAIGDYRWTAGQVEIDLGEHVTWHWVGPDLMHSVTGVSDNARSLDSDPAVSQPEHTLGDSYQLAFNEPGTYEFQCKLHGIVGGSVLVSSTPGDPIGEPDPIPEANLDRRRPRIRHPRLAERRIRARGTPIELALDERATLDAEYYLRRRGERPEFVGYERWSGFVGLNRFRFGGRAAHFRAKPGRYLAELRATDRANNVSRARTVRFSITRRDPHAA